MARAGLAGAFLVDGVEALDRAFVDLVRDLQPAVVTDVGSRDGEMAILCQQAQPGAQVFAFEANPENFFEHATAVARHGVVFVPMAVGAGRSWTSIQVPRWATAAQHANRTRRGVGSLRPRHDTRDYVTYAAAATSLGEFFALPAHREATFAHWIDVEGCSHEVLEGLGPIAERTLFFKIEVETRAHWQGQKLVDDCLRKAAELGFDPVVWFDHDEQFDVICANRGLLQTLGDGGATAAHSTR